MGLPGDDTSIQFEEVCFNFSKKKKKKLFFHSFQTKKHVPHFQFNETKITQVTTLSQLLDVSPGLFYYILSFCGARDLSSCEQVSKTWHKVMRARVASRLWKVQFMIVVQLLFLFVGLFTFSTC